MENWIWLPEEKYPQYQRCDFSALTGGKMPNYCVAEFVRTYDFGCPVVQAQLRFSGDTEFRLEVNGETIATGPANVGGDFLYNDQPRSKHYAFEMTVAPGADKLHFFARVKMTPVAINEYSRGRGGFMLSARVLLADGRVKYVGTDETWQVRRNAAFRAPYRYSQALDTDAFVPAQALADAWHCETAPIPVRSEETVLPATEQRIVLAAGETRVTEAEFDRIYGGFVAMDVRADGPVQVKLACIETDVPVAQYELEFSGSDSFRGLQLVSAGKYRLEIVNHGSTPAEIRPYLIATCYPAPECALTATSDSALNRVLDVCRHTLKYCRQMIHLDSPKHSEPLACTGDYYIESLMTAMSFGDMRLAEFDIIRTAELLRAHDGRMFHTTYSLIWAMMLWDVYKITGNRALLMACEDALHLLLDRFAGYVGENGLLETPPDFMFVDWIYIDGISMHHPPKALGQTCLCAFYCGALAAAEKVYAELNCMADAADCAARAKRMKTAVNELLYDAEKGLYCDGLNTPTPEEMLYEYLPQNIEKRYFMPHSAILCALFGVCDDDTARRLIRRAVNDAQWGACQPYFKHYLLEAIFRLGLCGELTRTVLEDWKAPVQECPKGLVEGFIAPEPGYSFDHSHAWGGTPLYALPKALLGLEIVEPGYAAVRLKPDLLGLEWAHVEVPTPFGMIRVDMKAGMPAGITVPKGVRIVE